MCAGARVYSTLCCWATLSIASVLRGSCYTYGTRPAPHAPHAWRDKVLSGVRCLWRRTCCAKPQAPPSSCRHGLPSTVTPTRRPGSRSAVRKAIITNGRSAVRVTPLDQWATSVTLQQHASAFRIQLHMRICHASHRPSQSTYFPIPLPPSLINLVIASLHPLSL